MESEDDEMNQPTPAPQFHLVTARCQKCGGVDHLRFDAKGFTLEMVQMQAGLLDGTSPMYVKPPDEQSCIGKCGKCGGRYRCQVTPA